MATHALQTMHAWPLRYKPGSKTTYRFLEKVFIHVKSFCRKRFQLYKFFPARFARRAVIFLVLYIVYADGGNIHGPSYRTNMVEMQDKT